MWVRHRKCGYCDCIGHEPDMNKEILYIPFSIAPFVYYYHPDCYAKKYNVHKCECGCGKWVANKEKKSNG